MKRLIITGFGVILALILVLSCARVEQKPGAPVTGVLSVRETNDGRPGLPEGPAASSRADLYDPRVDKKCLEGRWEVAGLEQMISGSNERSGSSLRLDSVNGRAVYEFDSQREMKISYEGLVAGFSGIVDGQEMIVYQFFEGSATAQYLVDSGKNELILSGFGDEDIYTSLEINGQRLVEGTLPLWRAFTSSLTSPEGQVNSTIVYSIASIACQDNTLSIQAQEPFLGPALTLNKIP